MAKGNETTTKFKVDISELKSAMQEARKQVAYANSEFKATASSMDDWSKSSEGISAKLKQLNSNLKSQEAVLSEYEKTLEEIKKEYGENSKEALEYATKLNNQQAVVNKTKKEIAGYEDALQEVSEAEKIASKTGRDVADVLADVGNEADDAGDGFTVLKGAVADFVGSGLTALASGVKDAIGSFMGLAEETREYREDLAKLETAFTTAGFTTEQATDVYKDFYAVLGEEDRSVEAVNHLAQLVDSEKDLQTWTDICTGVWATFGDSLPIEGLTEASNETAKTGQLTGGLADALNWAGQSEEEFQAKLDSLNTEQERSAFITETLNGLYSATADEYRKNNASVMEANKAQSDYTDTLAQMGEKVEPVMTALKIGVTGLLEEFIKLVDGVDMELFITKINEGFGVLKDDVLPAIKDGLAWIIDNKELVIGVITGIASVVAGLKILSFITMIGDLIAKFKNMTTLLSVLKIAFTALTGPVGIVIAIISALVAGFIHLWKTSDEFRAFWIGLWENIKGICSKAFDVIGKFFTETFPAFIDKAIEFLKQLPQKVWTWLVNTITKIETWKLQMWTKAGQMALGFVNKIIEYVSQLPSKVWTWLINTYNKISAWATDVINKAKEAGTNFVNKVVEFVSQLPAKVWTWLVNTITKVAQWASDLAKKGKEAGEDLFDSVVDEIKGLPEKMLSIGGDLVAGLWNGINNKVKWLKDKISGFVGDVTDWLKDKFDINSPSKLMADEVGRWLPEGIAVGISDNAKSVLNAMRDLAVDTVGSARAGLNSATTTLGGGAVGGGVVNNFTQVINSPKQLSRLDIYRQSKNLLGYAGGGF